MTTAIGCSLIVAFFLIHCQPVNRGWTRSTCLHQNNVCHWNKGTWIAPAWDLFVIGCHPVGFQVEQGVRSTPLLLLTSWQDDNSYTIQFFILAGCKCKRYHWAEVNAGARTNCARTVAVAGSTLYSDAPRATKEITGALFECRRRRRRAGQRDKMLQNCVARIAADRSHYRAELRRRIVCIARWPSLRARDD